MDEPLSHGEIEELEALIAAASPAPWRSFVGPGLGGDDFIRLGDDDARQPDMYVKHDASPAPAADLDFIAAARNYLPRLVAEVRLRRADAD